MLHKTLEFICCINGILYYSWTTELHATEIFSGKAVSFPTIQTQDKVRIEQPMSWILNQYNVCHIAKLKRQ